MDTIPNLVLLALEESPWDYSTPLYTMINASDKKRKAMRLAKTINSFPKVETEYFAARPMEDQTCSICKIRYQHLPPRPADKANYHTNNLATTDRSQIDNNLHVDNPAICLPCGHILCKSCTKNWLSINSSCSSCRHPIPLPVIVFPLTAIDRFRQTCNLARMPSCTWRDFKAFILDSGLGWRPQEGGLDKARCKVAKDEVDRFESALVEESDRGWLK